MLRIKVTSNLDKTLNKIQDLETNAKLVPALVRALAIPKLKELIDGMPEEIKHLIRVVEEGETFFDRETDDMASRSIVRVVYADNIPDEFRQKVEDFIAGPLKEMVDNETTMHALGWGSVK